jgi:uncharacterized 2Fe-2S/4Fe-4S cluster protein (DUF4445 family)
MSNRVRIRLHPQGTELDVQSGTPLQDILFPHGVEFPCGGRGRCKGCRVRLLQGTLPVTDEQERMLTSEEIQAGWRLSCQCSADRDITIELAQWEASILTDHTSFDFHPREGLAIAVDLGTTTIVAQLLDLKTARVLAIRTGLNPQARFGADVMSRVSVAVEEGGHTKLVEAVRGHIGKMVEELLEAADSDPQEVVEVVLVGNSVMHHLFCDLDLSPLAHYPFESSTLGEQTFRGKELGWPSLQRGRIRFLPCIGGYVGSDILAGVVATGMQRSEKVVALVDLGTNGEIVLGNRDRLVCSSTAAGPAFEGARIFMGMRASTGAISEVHIQEGKLSCHVLGNVSPKGICGSGLVDAVAACLDLGLIQNNGRLSQRTGFLTLCSPVRLSQTDVRELQLAKGAIAAGMRILLDESGLKKEDLSTIYLAGAFGNYINIASAERIGLIPFPEEMVEASGNTALLGGKMSLFADDDQFDTLAGSIDHISLHAHPLFQDIYVEEMAFPGKNGPKA